MGDIADMIIEGEMCEQCGEYLGEGFGYPRLCSACQNDVINEEDEDGNKNKRAD